MPARAVPGLDAEWLASRASEDPIHHAWAVWDRQHFADRVGFVTLLEDGRPTAYLLLWRGAPPTTVVHWVGTAQDPMPLLEALPERPLIAVVPPEVVDELVRRRGPAHIHVVLILAHEVGTPVPPPQDGRARQLIASDVPELRALAGRHPEVLTRPYATADPTRERLYGAFHVGRLASVARAQVALPSVWIVGGVFTVPEFRSLGLATDVLRAIVREAVREGARPALYVREDNAVARRIYDQLGFRTFDRRAWVEIL